MEAIRLFVCDDDPLFRELLVDMLSREDDFVIAGSAAYKHQLLRAVEEAKIDVLLPTST